MYIRETQFLLLINFNVDFFEMAVVFFVYIKPHDVLTVSKEI